MIIEAVREIILKTEFLNREDNRLLGPIVDDVVK